MPKIVWTPEMVKRAKELRAHGLPFSSIGERLGVTRCSVGAMFYRLAHASELKGNYLAKRRAACLDFLREPRARIEVQREGYSSGLLCNLVNAGLVTRMRAGVLRDFCDDLPNKPLYLYVIKEGAEAP